MSLERFIEPKFTVGSVPEYDFARIRFSLTSYEQAKLSAHQALEHDLYSLGAAMGGEVPAALTPVESLPAPPSINASDLIARAVGARPDFKAQTEQVMAGQSAVNAAQDARWPVLKLGADYGYGGYTANSMNIGWGIAASLNMPIFDFGQINTQVEQAKAQLHYQKTRLEELKLQIRTDIHDAVEMVQTSWANLQSTQKNLPLAKKAYSSSLKRYRTGLAQMAELNDAHSLYIDSLVAISNAKAQYQMALARLDLVEGLIHISARESQ